MATGVSFPLRKMRARLNFACTTPSRTIFLEKLVGPVFFMIANSFVEAFIQRAEEVYGES